MRKFLSLFIVACSILGCQVRACETKAIKIPTPASDLVYIGLDDRLPVEGCYWFAVNDPGSYSPHSMSEAAGKIIAVMPHWMRHALREGRGINECVVVVNNVDYLDALIRFYVDKWRAAGLNMSSWRTKDHGGEPVFDPVVDALQDMVCLKVRR